MRKLLGSLTLGLGLLTGVAHADVADLHYDVGFSDGGVGVPDGSEGSSRATSSLPASEVTATQDGSTNARSPYGIEPGCDDER